MTGSPCRRSSPVLPWPSPPEPPALLPAPAAPRPAPAARPPVPSAAAGAAPAPAVSAPVVPRPARRSASSRPQTRSASSAAAFLVNVSPSTRSGRTIPFATSHTSRAAMVSLLPEPAPAITAIGPSGAPITAACSGVGSAAPSSRASWAGLYRAAGAGLSGVAPAAGPCRAGPAAGPGLMVRPRSPRGALEAPPSFVARSSVQAAPRPSARSRGHLRAALVYRAAGRDRADPATGVGRGVEHRPGHSLRHGLHEIPRPARFRVAGQRALLLHPRPGGQPGPAHLHKLGAAGPGQAQVLERAQHHGELVDAELRVPVQLLIGRAARPGLEVHDDGAAVGILLQPVHAAGYLHPPDADRQLLLDGHQPPRVGPVPVEELADHPLRLLALLGAVPGAAEVEVTPGLVDPLGDVGVVGAIGGQRRRGVDHDPEVAEHAGRVDPRRGLEQPAQPALGKALHLGRRQPDV